MSEDKQTAPPDILQAISTLSDIQECEVMGDLFLYSREWALPIRLTIDSSSEFIPSTTPWVVVLEEGYPHGNIEVLPAKDGGIERTFQHQSLNKYGDKLKPWREGKLCLDLPSKSLGLFSSNDDPVGNTDQRLRWHILRALSWLHSAARDELIIHGDPFEFPVSPKELTGLRFVHDENNGYLPMWLSQEHCIGYAIIDTLHSETIIFAVSFQTLQGNLIRQSSRYSDQLHNNETKNRLKGVWWKWDAPIVNRPWEQPATWGDLILSGRQQNIAVMDCMSKIAKLVRDKNIKYLLMGYPITEKTGSPPHEMHWQALKLPLFTSYGGKPTNGYPPGEKGWWLKDRTTKIKNTDEIIYIASENWHEDRLRKRGGYAPAFKELKVVLIGAGALGSIIAELLARGGVRNFKIIDMEKLEIGNLSRHTLLMGDIGKGKADSLCKRLSMISPHINAEPYQCNFPSTKKDVESQLFEADMVIDCTASDDVLRYLFLGRWLLPKIFVSVFVGFKAERLFLFVSDGFTFPLEVFNRETEAFVQKEREKVIMHGELLQGAGCWSPLFPARYDNITIAASVASKMLERAALSRPYGTHFFLFEQSEDANGFPFYSLIHSMSIES